MWFSFVVVLSARGCVRDGELFSRSQRVRSATLGSPQPVAVFSMKLTVKLLEASIEHTIKGPPGPFPRDLETS